MPSRRGKNQNGSPVDGRTVTTEIRLLGTYTTVITGSTQFGQTLHPLNFGARAIEFCDLFEEYRWVEVKVSYNATYSTSTSNPVMSIMGITASENLTAAPTTAAQIAQFDTAHATFLNQTVPNRVSIPKEVLRGHQDWYSANNGSDAPAVFFFAGMSISTGLAVAGTIQVMWEGRLQFKGSSDPSVSIARRLARDKKVLLDESDSWEESSDTSVACGSLAPGKGKKRQPASIADKVRHLLAA